MVQCANSNTHLPGCAEKQRRNTTTSKHPETQQNLTLYSSRHFLQPKNPKLFSELSDQLAKNQTVAYDIQRVCFSNALAFFSYWRKVHFDADPCREAWTAVLSNKLLAGSSTVTSTSCQCLNLQRLEFQTVTGLQPIRLPLLLFYKENLSG